jgi:hypothetical protein
MPSNGSPIATPTCDTTPEESGNNEKRGGHWWVTKVVDSVFKTLLPFLARDRAGTTTG